jgi:hypothetical protein
LGECDEAELKKLSPIAIGGDRETFAEDTLLDRKLWNAALRLRHYLSGNTPTKTDENALTPFLSEYERRSSIAAVSFAKYYPIKDKSTNYISEHQRWMAYSYSEGMQYIEPEHAEKIIHSPIHQHRDTVAGLTPCLTKDITKLDRVFTDNILPAYHEAAQKEGSCVQIPKKSFSRKDQDVIDCISALRSYADKPIEAFTLPEAKE